MIQRKARKIITRFVALLVFPFFLSLTAATPSYGKDGPQKAQTTEETLSPITLQFLSLKKNSQGKWGYTTGRRGSIYTQAQDLLFRFTISNDGYVYLVSINNDGVFIFFPFGSPEIFKRGTHELAKEGLSQHYPLRNTRGDLFVIALFSKKRLDPKRDISPFFKDIKWLKDGRLDTVSLTSRFPGSAVDYLRIFVEQERENLP